MVTRARAAPISVGTLRDGLDRDGCAHGQVTRERVDNIAERLDRIESRLGVISAGVVLQLVSFVFGILLFVLNHVRI